MFRFNKLRQLAYQEYEQARGTAHKNLLRAAQERIEYEVNHKKQALNDARVRYASINRFYQEALEEALVKTIVTNRLDEVQGIGQQRKEQIIQQVFRGKLADLHLAHQVPGVGLQTQSYLNRWIETLSHQMPSLLRQSFPGKEGIEQEYRPKLQEAEKQEAKLAKQQKALEAKLHRIEQELKWLETVSPKEFLIALKNQGNASKTLNRYVQGVFGEWEPMPDWFGEAIGAISDDKQQDTGNKVHARPAQTEPQPDKVIEATPIVIAKPPPKQPLQKKIKEEILRTEVSDISTVKPLKSKVSFTRGLTAGCIIAVGFICWCSFLTTLMIISAPDIETQAQSPTTTSPTLAQTAVLLQEQPILPTSTDIPPSETAVPTASPTQLPTATATAVTVPQVHVTSGVINVRAGPSTDYAVIATLLQNDLVDLLSQTADGYWYRVQMPDGTEGWVGSSVVELLPGTQSDADR